MKRVLLLGAGHAQLAVLAALARRRLPDAETLRRNMCTTPSAVIAKNTLKRARRATSARSSGASTSA